MTTTYVDANALIVAYRGEPPAAQAVLALLGDPARRFVASPYLRLETLRKPLFYPRDDIRRSSVVSRRSRLEIAGFVRPGAVCLADD